MMNINDEFFNTFSSLHVNEDDIDLSDFSEEELKEMAELQTLIHDYLAGRLSFERLSMLMNRILEDDLYASYCRNVFLVYRFMVENAPEIFN